MTPVSGLDPTEYAIDTSQLLTPALAIYPDRVRSNIACTVAVLDGRPERWRPHLKTVKLGSIMQMLAEAGVTSAKCATSLELLVGCQSGLGDILVAYPHTGPNARRIAEIATAFPNVRVSAIVESVSQVEDWTGTPVELFVDVNPGMNRTGIGVEAAGEVSALIEAIKDAGLHFRGLHYYDGHSTDPDLAKRTREAHARYDQLLALISALDKAGISINEIIAAGTPALPCAISYAPFWNSHFQTQVSPGTVVYNDTTSLAQLPEEYGFRPAALVVARVVSHPKPGIVTCDAGHKSLCVDSGVPNCLVLGRESLQPAKPSEEHLPLQVNGDNAPPIGSILYLLPRHICPTVNNFDFAALIENGRIGNIEPVSARGREGPLPPAQRLTVS